MNPVYKSEVEAVLIEAERRLGSYERFNQNIGYARLCLREAEDARDISDVRRYLGDLISAVSAAECKLLTIHTRNGLTGRNVTQTGVC